MKFNLYKSASICALLALTGCHDFEEMNTNPYQPVYDPSIIGGTAEGIDIDYELSENAMQSIKATESAAGSTFQNFLLDGMYNDFQITTSLTHDQYASYWTNAVEGFVTQAPTYAYTDGWSARRWSHFYDDRSVSEYSQLIKTFWFCNKEYYHTAFYITRIYYAFLLSAQTDTYGDIPIQYYVKGAIPPEENVVYTSQKEVYQMIFDMLDQAVTKLTREMPSAAQYDLGDYDKVYGGDKDKWVRFANTLRLRLALRVSNVDNQMAKKQAQAALDPNNGGLITSNEDNMVQIQKISYLGSGGDGEKNMYAVIFGWGAQIVMSKELEWAYKNEALKEGITENSEGFVTKSDADGMKFNEKSANCYLDPRCGKLWYRPSPWEDLGGTYANIKETTKDFKGMLNGTTGFGEDFMETYSPGRSCSNALTTELYDDCWWTPAREVVWLGYAESWFLRAEAALRGWSNDDVDECYTEGIKASMEYYNISESDYSDYLNHVKKPADYTDKEEKLERIITQKWIAVFPNGNEGWAELRRTDYPRYAAVPLMNTSNGEVPNGKLIKRIDYPNSEGRNPNKPGLDQVNQGTRVWWDVADTMDDNGKWRTPRNIK